MYLRLGDMLPNFRCDSTKGSFDFYAYKGQSWALLVAHPADFTPTCTTELAALARLAPAFRQRNCVIMGLSVDTVDSHARWAVEIEDWCGSNIDFPILADPNHDVAHLLGLISPALRREVTVRASFLIGPDNTLRLAQFYPLEVGRSTQELLRALDALRLVHHHPVETPAEWIPGEDVVVAPRLETRRAEEQYGPLTIITNYLRFAPHPPR